jgi:hypothetical protein
MTHSHGWGVDVAINSTNAGGAADVAFSAEAVLGVRRLSLL